MADRLKQLSDAAEKKKKQMAAANALKVPAGGNSLFQNATLMEQATGPRETASPTPTIVKPSVQAAREKQYGIIDHGGTRAVDNVMPTLSMKPATSSPARQAAGLQALEQWIHQPSMISDVATRENYRQMEARAALGRDTATADADRSYQQNLIKKQKDDLQGQINDVLNQIEIAADARDNKTRIELSQTLADLRSQMNELDSRLSELNIDEVADWENRQYNEIMAYGGSVLMVTLEKLDGLKDAKIKEAVERGDERRSELTELEKEYFAKYDELKSEYGDKVDSWLAYIERMKNKDRMGKALENARSNADNHPFWSSLGSIPLNAISGIGYVDVVGQKMQRYATGSDAPIDYNSPAQTPSKMTNTIRETVSEDMSSAGKFFYNTAMSLGDSALAIGTAKLGLGQLGTVLLGGAAATNATQAAAERGASDTQALFVGLIAGVTEALLEKTSIDSLFNLKKNPETLKDIILNVLRQLGAEGTEEGLTNIVNTIADGLIMRDKSELETIKRKLMADGMSREEAEIAAIKEWASGFALDVAGGMLSGSVTGSFKSAADYKRYSRLRDINSRVDAAMPTIPQAEQQAQPTVPVTPTVDSVMPTVQSEQTGQQSNDQVKMPAMGAADEGFNAYSHYQATQDQFIPEGANAARPVDVPVSDPTGKNTRRYLSNAMGAQSLNEGTDAKLQEDFMAGKYGYEVKGDKAAVDTARAKLENSNYDAMRGATLERLENLKDLKQTIVDAQILAVEAMRNGRDADAAELFLMIATTETEFGQAVQAASILRKLSPEGQLEAVRRVAARLDAKKPKSKKAGGETVSQEEQTEIMHAVDDVRETALRLLENIHEAFDTGRDHGVPVEDWLKEIGKKLANVVASSKQTNRGNIKTVAKTIEADLRAFAEDYITKQKSAPRYKSAEAVENFLNNPEQHAEAWGEAKAELLKKYKDNAPMLDALDSFLNGEISLNGIGNGITKDINKAISEIGAKVSEIIRSSKEDKATIAKQITDMLMKDHQLSNKDAKKMADFILQKFNQQIAKQSEKTLENMFKEWGKKPPKTVMQKFAELANMGAFTGGKYNQKATQKLFGEGLQVDPDLAQKFLDAKDEASRAEIMEEIYKDLGSQMDTTFGDVARRWRYTAMLLNPVTHLKNMAGNATQLAEATVKDAIAAVGEGAVDFVVKAIRKGNGIQRTKALLNPLNKADAMLLQQAGDDYSNVMEAIVGGSKWKDTPEGKISQYKTDMKLNNPHTKVGNAVDVALRGVGKVADFNEAAMNVEDSWFAKPRYQAALAGYMKANNLTEITDKAREYAIQEAKKSTYRDSNAISDFARSMGNSRKKNWVTKSVDFFVNAIFPFKGTPANVGVRAVEYSPAGLIATLSKGAYNAVSGQFDAASFIDDLSANITGSALMGVGIWLAQMGVLRAKGAEDEKEKEQLEKEGYKDNSINVFGYSVPIFAFGAVSVPLLLGAAVYENFVANNPGDEGHPIDDFLSALSGTLDPVLETTMLTGFQDAIQSFQQYDPNAKIGETLALGAVDIAGNYIASFIPALLSRVANSTDTSARQVYVDKNEDAQAIRRVMQTLQKKIPGLRNQMTEVVDAYGNTVEGGLPSDGNMLERVMKGIGNAVTPIYGSKIKTTAVDEEVRRLLNAESVAGDYTLVTPEAPKSFEVGNKTVYLTGDQYVQYQKTLGSSVQSIRNSVMNNEAYESLPDDVRAAAMSTAYEYANVLAKTDLGVGYKTDKVWMQELFSASPEVVAQTIVERVINNAAEDKDLYQNKYLGLNEMLESRSIDDQVALACMSESNYTAYTTLCEPAGVSVSQFLDMYGTAYASGENAEQRRSVALENIQKMDISAEQKTVLAQAVYSAFGSYAPVNVKVPDQWLLDNGDIETIEAQMSDTQRQGYDAYIKDSPVDMQTYLDFHTFAGETKGSDRQDKIIVWLENLDATDEVKGRLFCTIYSRSNCPLKWRTGVPRD